MLLKKPVLFINFKTYAEATGKNAVSLARKAESVAREEKASVALVVQAADLRLVASSVKLPVFAQHVDTVTFGRGTGLVLPESVKQAGAVGTVLNHAENKRDDEFLKKAIERAREAGLAVMVCAESLARAKIVAGFSQKPDFIAVEPPELIGGEVSVSSAKPELIEGSVKAVKAIAPGIRMITGAGIKNAGDAAKAVELGTEGIFVSLGVVKAEDQKAAIKGLVLGMKR